jgi:hypothetical protein
MGSWAAARVVWAEEKASRAEARAASAASSVVDTEVPIASSRLVNRVICSVASLTVPVISEKSFSA